MCKDPRNEDRLMTFVLIWEPFKNDLFYDKLKNYFAYINMEAYRILSLKSLFNNYRQVMNE